MTRGRRKRTIKSNLSLTEQLHIEEGIKVITHRDLVDRLIKYINDPNKNVKFYKDQLISEGIKIVGGSLL